MPPPPPTLSGRQHFRYGVARPPFFILSHSSSAFNIFVLHFFFHVYEIHFQNAGQSLAQQCYVLYL